jgi:hypothetical protein
MLWTDPAIALSTICTSICMAANNDTQHYMCLALNCCMCSSVLSVTIQAFMTSVYVSYLHALLVACCAACPGNPPNIHVANGFFNCPTSTAHAEDCIATCNANYEAQATGSSDSATAPKVSCSLGVWSSTLSTNSFCKPSSGELCGSPVWLSYLPASTRSQHSQQHGRQTCSLAR